MGFSFEVNHLVLYGARSHQMSISESGAGHDPLRVDWQ